MKIKACYEYVNDLPHEITLGALSATEREKPLMSVYSQGKAEWIGFGGAFTESSAYCYAQMSEADKQSTLEALFGESGLRYQLCRLCIGSADFALDEFCYVEDNDYDLRTFSIERDRKYVIPFVKDAIRYSKREILFFASPWSPPAFMKENGTRFSGGKLKKDCYALYAEYIVRFLKAYREEGIPIFALTLQNEPKAIQTWESCFYTAEDEIAFTPYLRSALDANGFAEVKLLCWDHNKERLYERADKIFSACPDTIDGAAYHWYSGEHFDAIGALRAKYPDKLILNTEFCKSNIEDKTDTRYCTELLHDIRQGTNGICDWNMILDEMGGPYHNRMGGCDACIRLDSATGSVRRNGLYWQLYMFSHFIEPGATVLWTSTYAESMPLCAVRNPNGEVVVNLFNSTKSDHHPHLFIDGKSVEITAKAGGLYTVILEP